MGKTNDELPPRSWFPPGLIGDIAYYIMRAAPHPNPQIALTGAIALFAGMTGKAYNTYTFAGLNVYILVLAKTAMGKEAANSGISKLLTAISAKIPAAKTFKGPMLISSAGLLKWLADNPSCVSVVGEFGYKLKSWHSPKASPNDEMLKAVLLDLYGKSGQDNSVDPMAYSDSAKSTGPIKAPALTLLCESVPSVVNEALSEQAVASGFVPRFYVVYVEGNRARFQEDLIGTPPTDLVERLAAVAAKCLELNSLQQARVVGITDDAKAMFRSFSDWITDQVNASASEVHRELLSRAHLKAVKLASLQAVAVNFENPVVSVAEVDWAIHWVQEQTAKLLSQFESGELGVVAGNEVMQLNELRRVFQECVRSDFERVEKSNYRGTKEMHIMEIVTHSYISNRLYNLPTFKSDPKGASMAINRAVRVLVENGEFEEVGASELWDFYGAPRRAKAYREPLKNFNSKVRLENGGVTFFD